jgi:hypothetical protein
MPCFDPVMTMAPGDGDWALMRGTNVLRPWITPKRLV